MTPSGGDKPWRGRRRRVPGASAAPARLPPPTPFQPVKRALHASLATFADDLSSVAQAVRQEFMAHLASEQEDAATDSLHVRHGDIHRSALKAARQAVLAMRDSQEIGDDAFHQIEEELDWLEMADGAKGEGEE